MLPHLLFSFLLFSLSGLSAVWLWLAYGSARGQQRWYDMILTEEEEGSGAMIANYR